MDAPIARLAALSLVLGLPLTTAAAPARWRLAGEAPVTHKATVAAFVDEQHGITAGYAGAVYVTQDGGKTWSPGTNSSACRFGLEALPGGAAWTAGNMGHVRVSRDGGAHWTTAASFGRSEPRHARHLSFLDGRRGLIASQEELAVTDDGGESWTKVAAPARAGMIAAVSLSEEGGATRLRLLDENGDLWVSADRGASWAQAPSPLKVPVFESLTAPRAAMRFTAAGDGVLAVIADEGGPKGHVYRTQDGGKTWGEEVVPGFPVSVLTISADAKLLTSFDQYTIRLYRAD